MFKTRQAPTTRRRGVILMVVLAMLTLFAIVGLTFVLYASSAADNARISREGETQDRPDLDPELAFKLFLGQLLYDTPDDETGVYSALRGHSLARTMYGWKDALDPEDTSTNPPLNDKAYSGTGRLHTGTGTYMNPFNVDDYLLVNYMYNPLDSFLRDPERYGQAGIASKPGFPRNSPYRTSLADQRGRYTGGHNAPYTYPDANSMFLAVIDPSSGQVILPSFHRNWTGFGSLDPANPNWLVPSTTNPALKYMVMRPRPIDMDPINFKPPADATGDVKNLWWAPGGNDSIWIDIGAPVVTLPDGRKVKMLVAPLIIDLDGRINLNVHGNVNGNNSVAGAPFHAGQQGWGPWEVNLSKVLFADNVTTPAAAAEWRNLFLGNNGTATLGGPPTTVMTTVGRYGSSRAPAGPTYTGGTQPRAYGPVDLNGTYDLNNATAGITKGLATGPYALAQLPGPGVSVVSYQAFPFFPTEGYGNGKSLPLADESIMHPLLYNPLRPQVPNRQLPLAGLAGLLRGAGMLEGDTNSEAMTSDLLRLCPQNFDLSLAASAPAAKIAQMQKARNLVTTLSMDIDRPGALPYLWDLTPTSTTPYAIRPPAPGVPTFPTGNPISFPALTSRGTTPASSEFDPATWRSTLAGLALGRLDLNRPLSKYPPVDIKTTPTFRQMFDLTNPATAAQLTQALADRQQFAQDIFNYLRAVTGAPALALVGRPGYNENRWLAQLAVNIVDFIDEDEYSTPFLWNTDNTNPMSPIPYYVYGTELPRLVLNEVFTEWTNVSATDPGTSGNWRVSAWLELLNPLYSPPNPGTTPAGQAWPYGTSIGYQDDGNVWLEISKNATGSAHYSAYRVVLADASLAPGGYTLDDTGTPPSGVTGVIVNGNGSTPWSALPATSGQWNVLPVNQQYAAGGTLNNGFYAVGPTATSVPAGEYWAPAGTGLTATDDLLGYNYKWPTGYNGPPQTDIYLQKLLCPYLPPNPATIGGAVGPGPYNPYITVDYIKWDNRTTPFPQRQQDGRKNVFGSPNVLYQTMDKRVSFGRDEPYAGHTSQLFPQNPATATAPKHTFFRHNAQEDATGTGPKTPPAPYSPTNTTQTIRIPFDWLVHLDRQLISPMELLYVSGGKPHELTQNFVQAAATPPNTPANGIAQSHRAPWFYEDPNFGSSRLHRFLEFAATHGQAFGVRSGGRIPGKVNINTLWDLQVFRALCDAQPGNAFRDTSGTGATPDTFVDQVFTFLMAQRTPGFPNPGQPDVTGPSGPGDRPFWSLSVDLSPLSAGGTPLPDPLTNNQRGSSSTLFRFHPVPATYDRTLDPYPKDHLGAGYPAAAPKAPPTNERNPYQRYEMLNKLFNNLTTRSNVFAVWLTVGFFEVAKDDAGNYVGENFRPVKLGAEVGKAEGRNIRHRMFAIVDRTNLTAYQTPLTAAITIPANQNSVTFDLTGILPLTGTNPFTLRNWAVQIGSVLVIDPNTDIEETMVVQPDPSGKTPNPFVTYTRPPGTDITKPYARPVGTAVISRGNPGPWTRYEPTQDTGVVPYFAVID
jgi:hypothetical protein